jgi:hypothetical protein
LGSAAAEYEQSGSATENDEREQRWESFQPNSQRRETLRRSETFARMSVVTLDLESI